MRFKIKWFNGIGKDNICVFLDIEETNHKEKR